MSFFKKKASEIRVIKIVPQAGDMAQCVVHIQRTCVWFPGAIMGLTPGWNHIQFRTSQGPLLASLPPEHTHIDIDLNLFKNKENRKWLFNKDLKLEFSLPDC